MIKKTQIVVDCEPNTDEMDLRAGGEDFHGYDFIVGDVDVLLYIEFIKEQLEKNNQPLERIYTKKIGFVREGEEICSLDEIKEIIEGGY